MLQSTNYQCDLDIVVLRKAGDAHGHKTVIVDSCGFVFACVFGVVLGVVLVLLLLLLILLLLLVLVGGGGGGAGGGDFDVLVLS